MDRAKLKICILDIETYKEMVLVGGYIIYEDKWILFEISRRMNQIDAMVKFILEYPIDYYATFNGVGFDGQVIQYILDNYQKWYDKTWMEICELVYVFVQELISNQNYQIQPPYKEQYMDLKMIDMFLILHMNNENRMTSLKWCAYSMDEDIEELPIDHAKVDLTVQDIEEVIVYWRNDIKVTHRLYQYCIGECDHELYKDKDKVQMRLDLIEEMKLPWTAINWNDVKIGTELNKKRYLELTGISQQKLWEKVKGRKTNKGFTFGSCYPGYWKFETPEFLKFFRALFNVSVNLNEKQEFPFTYNGTKYMFAKGGGHSSEGARILKPSELHIIKDCDVGSMYPWIIAKRKIYPAHLGIKWNEGYIENIPRRMDAKKLYKETKIKKYESVAEGGKYVLNGNFGKLLDRRDFQYDPYAGICTTVGGQIDIFMLAEDMEIAGMRVVSMNTDGLVVELKKDQEELYMQVCGQWERQVGNDKMGKLEYTDYELLVQTSVNDYIALKKDDPDKPEPLKDRIKKKGDFLTEYELYKNKSKRIVPIALEAYYIHGTPVEDTIRNWTGVYEFGIAKKASRDYYYQGVDRKTGKVNQYKKLIRYYCSTGIGEKIYKMKHEHSEKTGPKQSVAESTSPLQVVFNKKLEYTDIKELGIDYNWYIAQAKKLIHQIEPEVKRSDKIKEKGQLEMF